MNNRHPANNLKIIGPCRYQLEMNVSCLDQLIPQEHRARAVWDFVDKMDTSPCFLDINSFYGEAGRPASSPKVLFALWIYSILDGNTSARKLEELCKNHNVYKWIAGGIPINRTMLAEFRSTNSIKFDDLLTNCLAVMVQAGLIKDEDFSQDGTRVKANAGFGSFRRMETLENLNEEITNYLKELHAKDAASAYERRQKEAEIRIEEERRNRVGEALKNLEQAIDLKKKQGEKIGQPPKEEELKDVRASTTDPEVRKMKMGDGGFRLAYNVQFATGLNSRVIYGVDVVNTLDPGTAPRMMGRVHSRLRVLGLQGAKNWFGDAAYSGKDDIDVVAYFFPDCRYYAPPKTKKGIDPKKPQKGDSEAVSKWRKLIGTEDVENSYKQRSSTAEYSNAAVKNKGMTKFSMRGLVKVKGEAITYAIAQNVARFFDLINGEGQGEVEITVV